MLFGKKYDSMINTIIPGTAKAVRAPEHGKLRCFIMLGPTVNALAIVAGTLVGILLKKGIPEKVSKAVMTALALCVTAIGIDGILEGNNTLILIVSMVLGTILGTVIDIDGKIASLGAFIERKMKKSGGEDGRIAEGFMTASLLFCVGAMAIVGSLNSGLSGDHTVTFTKSLIDMISACMLASSLGIGVIFSAAAVFVYQGSLTLLAGLLQNVLTDEMLIAEITCAGSLMIVAIGFNMIGVTKIKVANFLPALLFVPLVYWLVGFLPM